MFGTDMFAAPVVAQGDNKTQTTSTVFKIKIKTGRNKKLKLESETLLKIGNMASPRDLV
jgi:hypothetical protein